MARVAGIELPREKRIDVALCYIYGIGPTTSRGVITTSQVRPERRVKDLTEDEVARINAAVGRLKVEGDLRREVTGNIKRLIDIGCYRGSRHAKSLPVRGQRTRTNARTRKGVRKTVGVMRGKQRSVSKQGRPGENAPAPEKKKEAK